MWLANRPLFAIIAFIFDISEPAREVLRGFGCGREEIVKRVCAVYIRHAGLIGALYAIVPVALWFGLCLIFIPFREVYLLRLVLSLLVGGGMGAYLNRFGLKLWLLKHRSTEGPATVLDGALIGGAIGAGIALLPPLTALIGSNDLEVAKTFIIVSWLAACFLGLIIGGTLAVFGRAHVEREPR